MLVIIKVGVEIRNRLSLNITTGHAVLPDDSLGGIMVHSSIVVLLVFVAGHIDTQSLLG